MMRPELNLVVIVGGLLMLASGFAFVGMRGLLMALGWRMRGRATGTIIGTAWGDEGETLPVVDSDGRLHGVLAVTTDLKFFARRPASAPD